MAGWDDSGGTSWNDEDAQLIFTSDDDNGSWDDSGLAPASVISSWDDSGQSAELPWRQWWDDNPNAFGALDPGTLNYYNQTYGLNFGDTSDYLKYQYGDKYGAAQTNPYGEVYYSPIDPNFDLRNVQDSQLANPRLSYGANQSVAQGFLGGPPSALGEVLWKTALSAITAGAASGYSAGDWGFGEAGAGAGAGSGGGFGGVEGLTSEQLGTLGETGFEGLGEAELAGGELGAGASTIPSGSIAPTELTESTQWAEEVPDNMAYPGASNNTFLQEAQNVLNGYYSPLQGIENLTTAGGTGTSLGGSGSMAPSTMSAIKGLGSILQTINSISSANAQKDQQQRLAQSFDPWAAQRPGAQGKYSTYLNDPGAFFSSPQAKAMLDQLNRQMAARNAKLGKTFTIDDRTGSIKGSGTGFEDWTNVFQANMAKMYQDEMRRLAHEGGADIAPNASMLQNLSSTIKDRNSNIYDAVGSSLPYVGDIWNLGRTVMSWF